jgi:hypothetical protein
MQKNFLANLLVLTFKDLPMTDKTITITEGGKEGKTK